MLVFSSLILKAFFSYEIVVKGSEVKPLILAVFAQNEASFRNLNGSFIPS